MTHSFTHRVGESYSRSSEYFRETLKMWIQNIEKHEVQRGRGSGVNWVSFVKMKKKSGKRHDESAGLLGNGGH